MNRVISLAAFGLAAASLPLTASAQSTTVEPGLYEVTENVVMSGRVLDPSVSEACVLAGANDKTPEDLLLGFTRKDVCPLSNVTWTGTTVRADYTCPSLTTGDSVNGTIDAEYGPDFINYKIDGMFGPFVNVKVNTDMRRKGECPATSTTPAP